MITEHTQRNEEEGETERGSPLKNQATVIMTEDKGIGIVYPKQGGKGRKIKVQ